MSFKKKVLVLIIISAIVKLFIANCIELGNDEVYYWTYALHLQMNYFDHPPLIALLIRITTLNLLFQQEFFLRFGAILCAAISTWLSYCIGKKIKSERTGWYAALLYTSSIYTSIISGLFIMPDSPQVVFWLLSINAAFDIFTSDHPVTLRHWFYWGLLSGICIMCKVHGIFLWAGFTLFMLLYNRKLFFSAGLYFSAFITLVIIFPIFLWNLQNNFITWHYHSSRVQVNSLHINVDSFIQAITGQIAYNNPLNVLLILFSLKYYSKRKPSSNNYINIIILFGAPIIITVTILSLFNNVLPHWSGPGFMTLQFLAAAYIDDTTVSHTPNALMAKYAVYLICTVAIVGFICINYYPGTLGSKKYSHLGEGDFTLDMYGWESVGADFLVWIKNEDAQNKLPSNKTIVCNNWFPAAHIDYYIARPAGMHVLGVGNINDLHHYYWLNKYSPALLKGDSALCIIPSNYSDHELDKYLQYFNNATLIKCFSGNRAKHLVRYFNVFLLCGYKANDELIQKIN